MKLRLIAYNVIAVAALAAANCDPPTDWYLAVTLRGQEHAVWCWAASGEMIMEYMGASIEQCDEANKHLGPSDCCSTSPSLACFNVGWPPFKQYNFDFEKTTNKELSWKQIKSQIYCKKKPFAFTWEYGGEGGHMMVATGYMKDVEGTYWVYQYDPLPVGVGSEGWITYENYVRGSFYTHWDDYYDVTPKFEQ